MQDFGLALEHTWAEVMEVIQSMRGDSLRGKCWDSRKMSAGCENTSGVNRAISCKAPIKNALPLLKRIYGEKHP